MQPITFEEHMSTATQTQNGQQTYIVFYAASYSLLDISKIMFGFHGDSGLQVYGNRGDQ